MLKFNSISSCQKGQLFQIIYESYKDFVANDLKNKDKYLENWQKFDDDAFNNPKIGKCVLVSFLNNNPIGLVSYDPRNFPEFGIIGQNCILPKFQKKGYGKKQIEEVLRIFKQNVCKKAKVTTANLDFFLPAQKMYLSLGFKETERHLNPDFGYKIIECEKALT